MGEQKGRRTTFESENLQNLKEISQFLEEKIQWIGIQMISANAEFNGEFNEIPLKIQIEVKTGDKKEKKRHLKRKICET